MVHRTFISRARKNRGAVAPLEFVMALPLLFVLMLCILWEGFWLIGQAEVLITARNDTWKKRFDDASGDPLLFPVLDDPIPLGLYKQAKDYVTEKATANVEMGPAFDTVPDPEASHTLLGGSWDHRAMPFEKAPHLKLMAVAAAVGTGGDLLDWVSQLTNPAGLVKKFQTFGTGIKSESDSQKANVGVDNGSSDDSGGGVGTVPTPDGKTTEQAKEDTEKKRQDEIRTKKEEYKQLGGRIPMIGPQTGQVVPERGELRKTREEIIGLQGERAEKFRLMQNEVDDEKKKKLQEELAQMQRKIDLMEISYDRLEQKFLDVSAELEALGINRWDQQSI